MLSASLKNAINRVFKKTNKKPTVGGAMEVGTYNYIRVNFFVEDGNKSQSKTRQPTIVNHIFKNPSLMHSPANTSHFIQPTV